MIKKKKTIIHSALTCDQGTHQQNEVKQTNRNKKE